jgi:type III secretion protein L
LSKVIKRTGPSALSPGSIRPTSAAPVAPPLGPPGGLSPGAPAVRKRIIEREVVGATQEAAEIKRRAEAEAQRRLEEATDQAGVERQRGFEEGKEEGLARYTREIAGALFRIRRLEQELEPLYVGLVKDCVEKILNQELKQHPEAILGVVRAALADARQQREVIVRVNPGDAEALRRQKNKLLEVLARANAVEIREDAGVTRGGCVVVTELGAIDASLERQLDALGQALQAELGDAMAGAGADDGEERDEDAPPDDDGY